MPHALPFLLTATPLLLAAAPGFTRSEIITLGVAGLGLLYFVLNRVNVVRDRQHAKREAAQEAAVKTRTETLKKLLAHAAEQDTKNLNFQQQIEHIGNELGQVTAQLRAVDESGRENKMKIENVKDSLGRIEAQLSTLLSNLLNRP